MARRCCVGVSLVYWCEAHACMRLWWVYVGMGVRGGDVVAGLRYLTADKSSRARGFGLLCAPHAPTSILGPFGPADLAPWRDLACVTK